MARFYLKWVSFSTTSLYKATVCFKNRFSYLRGYFPEATFQDIYWMTHFISLKQLKGVFQLGWCHPSITSNGNICYKIHFFHKSICGVLFSEITWPSFLHSATLPTRTTVEQFATFGVIRLIFLYSAPTGKHIVRGGAWLERGCCLSSMVHCILVGHLAWCWVTWHGSESHPPPQKTWQQSRSNMP